MTIDAYLEAVKERFVTDPLVTRFHITRERSTVEVTPGQPMSIFTVLDVIAGRS